MKYGLFVGAKIGGRHVETSMAGDSLTLSHFLNYVQTAERVGFDNLFVVEHHFTGDAISPAPCQLPPSSTRSRNTPARAESSPDHDPPPTRWMG